MGLFDTIGQGAGGLTTIESNIPGMIRNGQGYMASPGSLATATNGNLVVCAMSLFNPSNSGKSVLIYSLQVYVQDAQTPGSTLLRSTTTDPSGTTGFTNVLTPTNLKFGGAASAASASTSASGITASITQTGTILSTPGVPANTVEELLTNGAVILLPSGAANGIELNVFITTAAHTFGAAAKWVEF